MSLDARATALVRALGLCPPEVRPEVTPLAGGVASDIARVAWDDGVVCVKFALEKLRVAEDWYAPVSRNAAEAAWLREAGRILPGAAPLVLGRHEALGGFAMEMVADATLWKAALLEGRSDGEEAPAVARALGQLHAASADPGFDRSPFGNMTLFTSLRIEPYLTFTAARHPAVAPRLLALARDLGASSKALIHGDVSPKNILIRSGRPVFLDAECATMGDPAFDVAFCVNHLIVKGFHRPEARIALWNAARAFAAAHGAQVTWEAPGALDARVAALLPALMLARVDGKSPVEYLSEPARAAVRAAALRLLQGPAPGVDALTRRLPEGA